MNDELIIISNNPLVIANYNKVKAINGDIITLLNYVRDSVHLGHRLLTHPLAGSLKPNESPYKSVVISQYASGLDEESLSIIEGSLQVAQKMLTERPLPQWNERINDDFKIIDRSLLDSALASLSNFK